MTDVTPIRVVIDGSGDTTGLSEFQSGETLGLSHGGTGATTAGSARTNLGLSAIAASGSWTDLLNKPDTDSIPEGSANLYYADSRVQSYLTANSYTDQSYVNATVNAAVSNLLDGAPGVLDTLNELAAAIGDDANFITTITNQISAVQSNVDNLTTTNIPEGTNLYYTNERVDDRVADLIVDGVGISKSYDDAGNLLNISINFTEFDTDDIIEGSVNTFLNTRTTSDLTEGTNLYYTDERVDDRVSALITAGSNITALYSDIYGTLTLNVDNTGGFDLANNTTDDLSEGVNRLYYTTTRVYSAFDTRLATKSTTDLAEGSNLYFTNARATAVINTLNFASETYVDNADDALQLQINSNVSDITAFQNSITAEINRATAAENTLTTNLSTEVTRAQGAESTLASDLDDEVFDREQGDADLQLQITGIAGTLNTDIISEGSTNLYYTDARVRSHVQGQDLNLGANKILFSNIYATTADLPNAATYHGMFAHVHATGKGYFAHAGSWIKLLDESSSTTTDITEGTNLYYTDTRARGSISVTGDLTYDSATGVISTQGLASSTTDDLSEGTTNLYYTQARFDSAFTAKSTTNLSEGSNLYFTNERVDDRVSALIQAGSNVTVSYDDVNNTLTISATEDNLSNNTTDDLTEGSSNLYYTESRTDARIALQVGAGLDLSNKSTTDLSEGTNLYYTAARDTAQFNTDLATKSTTNLAEGTNLYFTDARVQTKLGDVSGHIIPDTDVTYDLGSSTHKFRDLYLSGSSIILGTIELKDNGGVLEQIPVGGGATLTYATQTYVTTQIANLVDTAPTTLDTLNELAAALGDDPNFATTITNSIATKLATADFTSTANTWLSTKSTSDITEGTNLYYTDARVRNQIYVSAIVTTSAGNFYIDGEQQVILTLQPGRTYRFDQSDASNTSHPLKFSEVSDGTHAGGGATEYTTGVTVNGTAGSAGAYVEITVTNATPRLYYYCANHSGMGGKVGVGKEMFVERITSDTWITGPIQTTTLNVGTGGSISATLGTVDFTNSTVVFSGATVNGLSNSDVGLANITDNAQGVVVTGKVAAGSLDIGTGGSINAALTTVDFSSSTVVFSGATVNGLNNTIQGEVDFHLNQSSATSNQVLSWNGSDYTWVAQSAGHTDTDSLTEGSTNLYYTDARVDARISATVNTASIISDLDDEIFDREQEDIVLQNQINSLTVQSLTDVDSVDTVATGDFLLHDGSEYKFVNFVSEVQSYVNAGTGNIQIQTLTDVNSGDTIANGDIMLYDGGSSHFGFINLGSEITSYINSAFSTKSTTDLSEGTNLYYTDSRVDARITNAGSVTQSDIDTAISNLIDSSPATLNTLNELAAALGDDANFSTTITNSIALKLNIADAATVLTDLGITDGTTGQLLSTDGSGNFSFTTPAAAGSSIDISATAPSSPSAGDLWFDSSTLETYIYYNDGTTSQWVEAASGSGGAGVSDTDDVSEGTTNLYYTDARVQAKLGDISGNIIPDTDVTYDLGSSTHKFRDLYLSGSTIHLGSIELSDNGGALEVTPIAGGSTSTFATTTYVTTAISNLVDTAPATLDTLNELAAALGDDANFSTTVTNSIATKLATADFTSTANTWLTTKSTTDLSEGTNLYYTNARADARIALQTGANLDLSSKSTTDLSEGTNLYYTDVRVRTHITGADLDMGSNDITTTGKMLFANMYATTGDLPSATTYHGMFAHVHGTGKGYFAHGGNWVELANNSQIIAQDFSWASITGTPTTIAGYGITDAFDGVFASLTSVPTTIAGYGITDAFDGTYASLTGTPTIPTSIDNLSDVDISTAAPTDGQTLVWDNANSKFIPGAASGGGGGDRLLLCRILRRALRAKEICGSIHLIQNYMYILMMEHQLNGYSQIHLGPYRQSFHLIPLRQIQWLIVYGLILQMQFYITDIVTAHLSNG